MADLPAVADSKFVPLPTDTPRGGAGSGFGQSYPNFVRRATILATQALLCLLALAIVRPPFVMAADASCDTEHVSLPLLIVVAGAAVGLTLSIEQSQRARV